MTKRYICELNLAHEGTCPMCGCRVIEEAPVLYNITTDEVRPATQEDIDALRDACMALVTRDDILRELLTIKPGLSTKDRLALNQRIAKAVRSAQHG